MADRRRTDATTDEQPLPAEPNKERVPSLPPERPLTDWDDPHRSGGFRFPRS
jgi:hypothetical protein